MQAQKRRLVRSGTKSTGKSGLQRIPIINLFYDLLFRGAPTMEQLNAVMAALALLSGLVASMAGALLVCTAPGDIAEMRNQTQRWIAEVNVTLLNGEVIDPYSRFKVFSSIGFVSVTASILSLTLMYLGVGSITFENAAGKESPKMMAAWWKWTRWLVFLNIALIGIGTAMLVMATQYLFSMQWAANAQIFAQNIWWGDLTDYLLLVALGILSTLVLLSGGLMARDSVDRETEKHFLDDTMTLRVFMTYVQEHSGLNERKLTQHLDRLCEEHMLDTVSDLLELDENRWSRLNLPMKLEIAMKKELFDEELLARRWAERENDSDEEDSLV